MGLAKKETTFHTSRGVQFCLSLTATPSTTECIFICVCCVRLRFLPMSQHAQASLMPSLGGSPSLVPPHGKRMDSQREGEGVGGGGWAGVLGSTFPLTSRSIRMVSRWAVIVVARPAEQHCSVLENLHLNRWLSLRAEGTNQDLVTDWGSVQPLGFISPKSSSPFSTELQHVIRPNCESLNSG